MFRLVLAIFFTLMIGTAVAENSSSLSDPPIKLTLLVPMQCIPIPHFNMLMRGKSICEIATEVLYDHNHELSDKLPVFVLLRNIHPTATFNCLLVDNTRNQYIIMPPGSAVEIGDPLTDHHLRFNFVPSITCSEQITL